MLAHCSPLPRLTQTSVIRLSSGPPFGAVVRRSRSFGGTRRILRRKTARPTSGIKRSFGHPLSMGLSEGQASLAGSAFFRGSPPFGGPNPEPELDGTNHHLPRMLRRVALPRRHLPDKTARLHHRTLPQTQQTIAIIQNLVDVIHLSFPTTYTTKHRMYRMSV
jgi:hypothetical protein